MNKYVLLLAVLTGSFVMSQAQDKFSKTYKKEDSWTSKNELHNIQNLNIIPEKRIPNTFKSKFNKVNLTWNNSSSGVHSKIIKANYRQNLPVWIEIVPSEKVLKSKNIVEQTKTIISELDHLFGIKYPEIELISKSVKKDDQNNEHLTLSQFYHGIKVYGAELKAHAYNGKVSILNGQLFPTPSIDIKPSLLSGSAMDIAKKAHGNIIAIKNEHRHLLPEKQVSTELMIYYPNNDPSKETLAYRVVLHPNLTERWIYFIDAKSGDILHKFKDSCTFFHDTGDKVSMMANEFNGPQSANELDLSGKTVNLKVYEQGGIYYLLNVSERMFNASQSELPNNPVGGILTLNAGSTSPQNDNFAIDHLRDNDNRWNNPNATSAHSNATVVYRYYDANFNRLSFDNERSTIYSIINVNEDNGDKMDNAFWNGVALYYGNGKQAFTKPLAAALDVAAHEFTHGVIQYEANLEYENEPGALNESFADIFAVLVDRDDWTLGEDVVNRSIFKTGALRSMSDPNNGGRSLNDIGWQPKHTNDQYRGREDNGGVHINSGIPNHAFFLFASNANVGLDRAEKIYYKALSEYLVSTSDFEELRLAVQQSIIDIHGQNNAILAAFNNAFDAVGIAKKTGSVSTGEPEVFVSNKGQDFVLWFKENTNEVNVRTLSDGIDNIISRRGMFNSPSISDDGSFILFIGADQNMYAILIDWANEGTIEEITIDDQSEWRNAAISKDGTKIAAVEGNLSQGRFDNRIQIFDLVGRTSRMYELYNPTTAQGVKTGDILFADALEWDIAGEYVMYDAQNEIISLFNDPINYWDIGFLRAWDNESSKLGDGRVVKLFPSLPEKVTIGNPTFAKNSPDIIAFDLLDERNGDKKYSILGVNLINGEQGLITNNSQIGYPDYSSQDDRIIYNAVTTTGVDVVASIGLGSDFINGIGSPSVFIREGIWGTWFNNGSRDLSTATEDPIKYSDHLNILPNPSSDQIELSLEDLNCSECAYKIFNTNGQLMISGILENNKKNIPISGLQSGIHHLVLYHKNGNYSKSFMKM